MSSKGKFKNAEGDWTCPDEKCGNLNFARRNSCNRCGLEKESLSDAKKKKQGIEIGKAAAEKSHGLFSAEDWQCTKCGNVNWARRQTCNMCNAPKVGELEERTGYGGGFNERMGVEYVKREEDSDDEFDAYGRKKKKVKGKEPSIKPQVVPRALSPPKLVSVPITHDEEEEEDDDDDDDDEDLSKYDLGSDDDENMEDTTETKKSPEVSSRGRSYSTSKSRSSSGSSSSSSRSRSRSRKRKNSSSRSPTSSHDRHRNRSRSREDPRKKRKSRRSSSSLTSSSSRSRSRSRSYSREKKQARK